MANVAPLRDWQAVLAVGWDLRVDGSRSCTCPLQHGSFCVGRLPAEGAPPFLTGTKEYARDPVFCQSGPKPTHVCGAGNVLISGRNGKVAS